MKKGYSEKKLSNIALKAGVWYTISSVLIRAISIITTPIYTRLMSTSDYGIFANFTAWSTLLTVFCSLNLVYSIGKAKQDFPGQLERYTSSMLLISAIFTASFAIFVLTFMHSISKLVGLDYGVIIALVGYLLFMPAITFVQTELRFQYKYKENILISIYMTLTTIIVSLIFINLFSSQKYMGRILGTVIPIALLSIVLWIGRMKRKTFLLNFEHWRYGISISIPLIIHVVSINILTQLDRIFISKISGNDMAGIYSLAYQYAILISVVTNAISEAWQPWFFDKYAVGEIEEVKRSVKPVTILGCFISICCIAIAPEAIFILGGKNYETAQWAILPITLAILCQYIYSHYVNVEMYLKKTYFISLGTILAAIVNIILNILFIPKYGFIAAAYATLMSYLVLMITHFIIATKILKVNIYNNWFLFLALIFTTAVSSIFVTFYSRVLDRYLLLLAVIIVYLFANRQYVTNFIKKAEHLRS